MGLPVYPLHLLSSQHPFSGHGSLCLPGGPAGSARSVIPGQPRHSDASLGVALLRGVP